MYTGEVDQEYWDSMAEHVEEGLLEIALETGGAVLRDEIERLAHRDRRVADLGCGPGSLLNTLAEGFRSVLAVDYSGGLLDVARSRCTASNVEYVCHDLSRGTAPGPPVEVACSVNALIDPNEGNREGMLDALAASVRMGGFALVVVPAFESVLHVYHTLRRCRRREGAPSGLSAAQAEDLLREEAESISGGLVRVGGILTKYWMREELLAELADRGLQPRRVRRIPYGWEEEIEDPPLWLGAPTPWDWLVVAERSAAAPEGCG